MFGKQPPKKKEEFEDDESWDNEDENNGWDDEDDDDDWDDED